MVSIEPSTCGHPREWAEKLSPFLRPDVRRWAVRARQGKLRLLGKGMLTMRCARMRLLASIVAGLAVALAGSAGALPLIDSSGVNAVTTFSVPFSSGAGLGPGRHPRYELCRHRQLLG
jgi:hypothetical protein